MSLLLRSRASPIRRGRRGVILRIRENVPVNEPKHDKAWWLATIDRIFDLER